MTIRHGLQHGMVISNSRPPAPWATKLFLHRINTFGVKNRLLFNLI